MIPNRQSIYKRIEQLEKAEQIRHEHQDRREYRAPSWRDMKPPPYIKRSELKNRPDGIRVPSWHMIDDE